MAARNPAREPVEATMSVRVTAQRCYLDRTQAAVREALAAVALPAGSAVAIEDAERPAVPRRVAR